MLAIPLSFLDGTDDTEHVCYNTQCVFPFSFLWQYLTAYIVNYAIYTLADRWVEGRRPTKISIYSAVSLVAFAGVIFRAELALLLGALSIHLLASERIGFNKLVQVGLRAVYASIGG